MIRTNMKSNKPFQEFCEIRDGRSLEQAVEGIIYFVLQTPTDVSRTFFFNSITKECQWIPPRNASKSNSASSPFIKAPNMIESARKPYPCDTLQNNSYPSSPSSDNTKQEHKAYPASSSLSTDSTSTESLKYAEPPLVVSTHVTNPLLEKELYLARSKAIDPLDKSMVRFILLSCYFLVSCFSLFGATLEIK